MAKGMNDVAVLSDVGRVLCRACQDMGVTVDDVAARTGISTETASECLLGTGGTTMADYLAICAVLRIDPARPFYGETMNPAPPDGQDDGDRALSCRLCRPSNDLRHLECWKDGAPDPVDKTACAGCASFRSRYIQYPATVNGIDVKDVDLNLSLHEQGSLVAVRPCGDGYGDETFLGLYLGELPWTVSACLDRDTGVLRVGTVPNPAIYVFKLARIVRGCESWWRPIDGPEDLAEITDRDIDDTWYVRLMRDMADGRKGERNG